VIFTFLSLCATYINGEIHICISVSCLRSSCKRRSSNGNRPTTAQHDGTRTPRPTVPSCWSLCGRAVVRSVFIETPHGRCIDTSDTYKVRSAKMRKCENGQRIICEIKCEVVFAFYTVQRINCEIEKCDMQLFDDG